MHEFAVEFLLKLCDNLEKRLSLYLYFNFLEIKESFEKFDEDWDEKVTLKELEKGLKKSGKMVSADELNTVITAMDKDGNTNYRQYLPSSYIEMTIIRIMPSIRLTHDYLLVTGKG